VSADRTLLRYKADLVSLGGSGELDSIFGDHRLRVGQAELCDEAVPLHLRTQAATMMQSLQSSSSPWRRNAQREAELADALNGAHIQSAHNIVVVRAFSADEPSEDVKTGDSGKVYLIQLLSSMPSQHGDTLEVILVTHLLSYVIVGLQDSNPLLYTNAFKLIASHPGPELLTTRKDRHGNNAAPQLDTRSSEQHGVVDMHDGSQLLQRAQQLFNQFADNLYH
jgi:hypothetical protein